VPIEGSVPDPLATPPGCAFHPRCPLAEERCRSQEPPLTGAGSHRFACWVTNERPELDLLEGRR
jgi:oligopeptide/dipeptide ABC transporter ATP-binding protein